MQTAKEILEVLLTGNEEQSSSEVKFFSHPEEEAPSFFSAEQSSQQNINPNIKVEVQNSELSLVSNNTISEYEVFETGPNPEPTEATTTPKENERSSEINTNIEVRVPSREFILEISKHTISEYEEVFETWPNPEPTEPTEVTLKQNKKSFEINPNIEVPNSELSLESNNTISEDRELSETCTNPEPTEATKENGNLFFYTNTHT